MVFFSDIINSHCFSPEFSVYYLYKYFCTGCMGLYGAIFLLGGGTLQDLTYLALATIHCFPFLAGIIRRIRLLDFHKRETASFHAVEHTLVFCVSGSGRGSFVNERICVDRQFSFQKNHLLYWEPVSDAQLTSMTENLRLLLIEFAVMTPALDAPLPPNEITEAYFESSQPIRLQQLSINLPFSTVVEPYGFMGLCLQRILKAAKEQPAACPSIAEKLLPAFVIQWLRVSQSEIDGMLHEVDSIWVSSELSYHELLKAGQDIRISNVEIWNGHPHEGENSFLLGSFTVDDIFLADTWRGERWRTEESPVYGRCGALFTPESSPYSLLLFPAVKGTVLNLKPFRSTCYFRFFLRSNMPVQLGVAAYSCKCFRGVGYAFQYTTPGEWQEEIAPVLTSSQALRMSSHIDQAIEYIKAEYASPIRRRDIAQFAGIRPEYLSDLFRQQLGVSVTAYINKIRLLESLKLLEDTNLSIENIAFRVGFYDAVHFSKVFQKQYGVRPSVYRSRYLTEGKRRGDHADDKI